MSWKRDIKRYVNDNSKNLFNVDGNSTLIFWNNFHSNKPGIYTEGLFLKEVKILFDKIEAILAYNPCPIKLKEYSFNFSKYGYIENFRGIGFSYFKETFTTFKEKKDSYKAAILVYALTKYSHATIEKFYEVYGKMFETQNPNDYNIVNLFETMKMTMIEQMQNIIDVFIIKTEKIELSPKAENYIIEEIIDIGDDFTLHWARMFREILVLANESMSFDQEFDFIANKKRNINWNDIEEDNFDEFFEKTKTMVISSEYDEALKYFNLTRQSEYDEFKKVYRKIAKAIHPDVNKGNPDFDIEMKKVNYYKSIIEKYMT
ncbi:hypothetical protein [Spiroplasma endosymbiont of Aspidapion aeneum]|uniref:hypothetical protein n=1 Tax=Spiroplasma endosymbiont of Aspidapion aeneum TaxID=3066276 RepID=UPI00313C463F